MPIDFDRLFLSLPSPYMMLDRDLRFVMMNDRYLAVTDRTREALVGRYVFDAFPETGERLHKFKSAFEKALDGEVNSLVKEVFSIPRSPERGGGFKEVWWTCHHLPVFDANGEIYGMLQKAEDVTAEVQAEKMHELISSEFTHRIKNILAAISSIAQLSAKSSSSTQAFVSDFKGRIAGLARTHEMLAAGSWTRMTLEELLRLQLRPFTDDEQVIRPGPPVDLSAGQAEALGMAFHELATNAAKYGAFASQNGELSVNWSADAESNTCTIEWREQCVPMMKNEARAGFGSLMLDEVLPEQLSGLIAREFSETGMCCTISFEVVSVDA